MNTIPAKSKGKNRHARPIIQTKYSKFEVDCCCRSKQLCKSKGDHEYLMKQDGQVGTANKAEQ